MWNRLEVKEKGKAAFKKNYWTCVVVGIVAALVSAKGVSSGHSNNGQDGASATFMLGVCVVAIALALFLFNVLKVGCDRFFLMNLFEPAKFSELGYGFKKNYVGIVATMFVTDLLIGIGTVLFVIPGVIMFYQYRMVPYILSEKPELSVGEVLSYSKEMMKGNKMDAFVYDLSFIGWYILTVCTLGIVGIFYLVPYKSSSDAELYVAIRSKEIQGQNAATSTEEN